MVHDVLGLRRTREPGFLPIHEHFIEQMEILFLLRRGVDQARIGGRIPRLEFLDALEIPRVRHHHGVISQLIQLARLAGRVGLLLFLLNGRFAHNHVSVSP